VDCPDRVEGHFEADRPGQRVVGDITYLKTGEGWLYLATVIELATRMVVGWQVADHMRTDLVTEALDMAILGGHALPG
jgi:transposase InsO family protein